MCANMNTEKKASRNKADKLSAGMFAAISLGENASKLQECLQRRRQESKQAKLKKEKSQESKQGTWRMLRIKEARRQENKKQTPGKQTSNQKAGKDISMSFATKQPRMQSSKKQEMKQFGNQ